LQLLTELFLLAPIQTALLNPYTSGIHQQEPSLAMNTSHYALSLI